MEEILNAANELGLLIRETGVYKKYSENLRNLESDRESRDLLEKYVAKSESIRERELAGDIIEQYERQELEELNGLVNGNSIIMAYLETERAYYTLLADIQDELQNE